MARYVWGPMRDLVTLQERMNRLFEDAADRQTRTGEETENEIEHADWFPAADVYETDAEFTIDDLRNLDFQTARLRLFAFGQVESEHAVFIIRCDALAVNHIGQTELS